ncbi:transmembrane protein 14A isoform X3 [Myotis myotis]|uniref:transmembrane protein 14A isoform X3 n=1 Tax=Myotis myotis TaxID=51298 RepID=UPI00174DA0A3|nr:transmembrane protein 14A isoform X3 [Myotis myotis]
MNCRVKDLLGFLLHTPRPTACECLLVPLRPSGRGQQTPAPGSGPEQTQGRWNQQPDDPSRDAEGLPGWPSALRGAGRGGAALDRGRRDAAHARLGKAPPRTRRCCRDPAKWGAGHQDHFRTSDTEDFSVLPPFQGHRLLLCPGFPPQRPFRTKLCFLSCSTTAALPMDLVGFGYAAFVTFGSIVGYKRRALWICI